MKKFKLSVAIATYNEEQNIARCLDSIRGWVDEIIIVDGSSTDKTVEIAQKYGVKIISTTNKPIFHLNKQMAIDECQGEWILQLDADEVVSDELKEEIIGKLKGQNSRLQALCAKHCGQAKVKTTTQSGKLKEPVGYWIKRKNYFLGKWLKKTGQYPDPVIRFFRKGKGHLPCKSVHEQIEINGEIGWFKGHLLHYSSPTFSDYLKRSNRYTTLFAQEMLNKNEKPSIGLFLRAIFRAKKDFFIRLIRCKGFMDGLPGFVFSFYSGLANITSYVKFWELYYQKRKIDSKRDWE